VDKNNLKQAPSWDSETCSNLMRLKSRNRCPEDSPGRADKNIFVCLHQTLDQLKLASILLLRYLSKKISELSMDTFILEK
jgi:hypothetical protein